LIFLMGNAFQKGIVTLVGIREVFLGENCPVF